jgi:hypothetical protein
MSINPTDPVPPGELDVAIRFLDLGTFRTVE